MARNTAPTPHAALPSVRKSSRWKPRIIEKCLGRGSLMAPVGTGRGAFRSLVADVLQEPLGGNLAARALRSRRFVDATGDRIELRALQVAALRVRHLLPRGASGAPSRHQVGEEDDLVGEAHAVGALAPALRRRSRGPGDVLVVELEVGAARGCGCAAEPEVNVDA